MHEDFFRQEYTLNHSIATLRRPHIALIDGITMGGGVGLSVHGSHRICTDSTLFAMPETGIGFFTDVGGSHFLPRLPGGGALAMYVALTGARLQGQDVLHAGVATHCVPKERLGALVDQLCALDHHQYAAGDASQSHGGGAEKEVGPTIYSVISDMLDDFSMEPLPFGLEPEMADIQRCFAPTLSVDEIMVALEKTEGAGSTWAAATLKALRRASPTSVKVTHELLRRGKALPIADCLEMEFTVSQHFMRGGEFKEGVRALLVDKDRSPKWAPARLEDVSDAMVEAFFEPIEGVEPLKLTHH